MFGLFRYIYPSSAIAVLRRAIFEREETQEKLRLADTVFKVASEAILVTDGKNRIIAANPAFTEITGYREEEILGMNPGFLNSGKHDAKFYREMWESLDKHGKWEGEIWNRRKNGEVYPEWLSISAIKGNDGEVHRYIGIFVDITKHKENEETIYRQANYDTLTGLPNRSLFMDRLSLALAQGRRKCSELAVMFIDLDRFSKINDTLGHTVGDKLLQEAGRRLASCVRESDTVARLGGDEFAIILPDIDKAHDAEIVAHKFLETFSDPFTIEDNEVFISGSIGITLSPADGCDAETLVKNADSAMYRAMEGGHNTYRFFTAEMNAEVFDHMKLANDLHHAVERKEFVLHYQPIIDPKFRRVTEAEALIRWNHPERGLIPPDMFIPLAEETGLIVPIGEWVFRTVCEQVKAWKEAGLPPVRVAVNLSSRQCREADFGEMIEGIIEETGVDPSLLALEITESILFEDRDETAMKSLHELRKKGIKLSLDDFGTGYSSISYLKRFPVDIVKIDRSFVMDVVTDTEDKALVEAIIAMANSLNTEVVGEGVENEEQMAFLLSRKCDFLQGYYFSKPLPATEFEDFMRQQRPALSLVSGG